MGCKATVSPGVRHREITERRHIAPNSTDRPANSMRRRIRQGIRDTTLSQMRHRSAENGVMNIEVLHIEECPSWVEAGNRLREALNATGFGETAIGYRLISTSEDAAQVPFAGSPTITIDGQDLFPSGGRTADLACRVYVTPNGLAGLPTTEQLVGAIAASGH